MKRLITAGFALLVSMMVQAEPPVIHDNGNTVEIRQYLRMFEGPERLQDQYRKEISTRQYSQSSYSQQESAPTTVQKDDNEPLPPVSQGNSLLPIKTPEMSVGRFRTVRVENEGLPRPICIIGSDDASLAWLEQNREKILQIGGFCWLVQAESIEDLKRVKAYSKTIPVFPASGSKLAARFKLQHYPVLITEHMIEQ